MAREVSGRYHAVPAPPWKFDTCVTAPDASVAGWSVSRKRRPSSQWVAKPDAGRPKINASG